MREREREGVRYINRDRDRERERDMQEIFIEFNFVQFASKILKKFSAEKSFNSANDLK